MGSRKQDLPHKVLRQNIIYGLVDPRDNCVKYVGQTAVNLRSRFYQHLKAAFRVRKSDGKYSCNNRVQRWIRKLSAQNLTPEPTILEEVASAFDLNDAEIKWVKYYRFQKNIDLVNETSGGDGVRCKRSKSWRKKISKSILGEKHPQARSVKCLNDGKVYPTIRATAEHYSVLESAVQKRCKQERKSLVSGYDFEFVVTNKKERQVCMMNISNQDNNSEFYVKIRDAIFTQNFTEIRNLYQTIFSVERNLNSCSASCVNTCQTFVDGFAAFEDVKLCASNSFSAKFVCYVESALKALVYNDRWSQDAAYRDVCSAADIFTKYCSVELNA